MVSVANVEAALKRAGRNSGGQLTALKAREVDALVSQLLEHIEVPYASLSRKVLAHLGDLKQVLAADYREVPGMPPKPLLQELAQILRTELSERDIWTHWENPERFGHLTQRFGMPQMEVKAEPYRRGAGLSLRGFFCRANLGDKARFVIFLNTAHHPGAVAATFGHELGHYLYGSLVGETEPMTAFMEGTFGAHLNEEHELFADSMVALAAYTSDQIKSLAGKSDARGSQQLLKRVQKIYESIGPRLKLDLKQERISASWRVSYLTSMIHFYKLRSALLDTAQI